MNQEFGKYTQLTFQPVRSSSISSVFIWRSSGSLSVSCSVSVPLSFACSSMVSIRKSGTNSSSCNGASGDTFSSIRIDFWRNNEPNFSKKPPSLSWILKIERAHYRIVKSPITFRLVRSRRNKLTTDAPINERTVSHKSYGWMKNTQHILCISAFLKCFEKSQDQLKASNCASMPIYLLNL